MAEACDTAPTGGLESAPYTVQSKPSTVIKSCQKTVTIEGKSYDLTLVTMKRSFLLVVKSVRSSSISLPPLEDGSEVDVSDEILVQSFMNTDPLLQGLSLAIGEHSTCLISSENSLASSSLAIRLSKKFNLNRPVYVASDFQAPTDTLDATDLMSKLYLKIFQFVGANYKMSQSGDFQCGGA